MIVLNYKHQKTTKKYGQKQRKGTFPRVDSVSIFKKKKSGFLNNKKIPSKKIRCSYFYVFYISFYYFKQIMLLKTFLFVYFVIYL